ncbi:MAG: hypothetical protein ACREM2_11110 [Vulcanimicrobiaceae bacterium]
MNEEMDDLDRALFALPLASPPSGLREAILRATVDAPVAATRLFHTWELVALASVLAVGTWLALVVAREPSILGGVMAGALAFAEALSSPAVFGWCVLGLVVTLVLSLDRLGVRLGGRMA